MAIYLNHLLFVNEKKGCITTAFYGIRWAHHTVGLDSPTDNPMGQLAYEGCIRSCRGVTQKKDALPVAALKKFVDIFRLHGFNLSNQRFLLVCLIGFCGFLRIDELLQVQLKHLTLTKYHLRIFLSQAKTDQHRDGEMVYVARTGTLYCPVSFTENFLTDAQLNCREHPECFLIPRLHKTKKGHNASKTRGISYTRIREIFMENIALLGSCNNYGLHSLRSRGASAAAAGGVSDRLISKQGRWASENARNGYIQNSTETRLSVTRALGL